MKSIMALLLSILMGMAFALSPIALTGCDRQGPFEELGEDIDDAIDETGDQIDDLTDR